MDYEDIKLVRDYLNGTLKEKELMNMFDLTRCPICGNVEVMEDMVYHKWDTEGLENEICPDCRENE